MTSWGFENAHLEPWDFGHPGWLNVLAQGLHHTPYCLEALEGGRTRGFLALAGVESFLFGSFLVSLPYLNYGGPVADDESPSAMEGRSY